jgi:16S rRNA (adenine1518-N6/adenine1519-N6)-dimethyltransferase
MQVSPKKHLGQHFLKDESVAQRIAHTLSGNGYTKVLEIGPGMGVLTKHLLQKNHDVYVVEIDGESVLYLEKNFPQLHGKIIPADFLQWDVKQLFGDEPYAVIGNYPYNISSQIVFRVIENRAQIPEMSGMFQREVAQRIASPPGNKSYGILSVLAQAYFQIDYLFTVDEHVFHPPPKIKSGVIRMVRREKFTLDCNEKLFKQIVKSAFNQRRKTLRNALKVLSLPLDAVQPEVLNKRAEQLSWQQFVALTQILENNASE